MPEEKIVEYIKGQLAAGFDRNKIRNELLMNGSLPSEIDLAFNSLNSNMQNQNTPVSAPVQTVPVPTPNPVIPPYPAANPVPVFTEQAPKGSIFKKVLLVVVILILIGAASAGAYFGYNYYIQTQVTLSGAVLNTIEAFSAGKITSGEISLVAEIVAKDVGKNYSDLNPNQATKAITSQFQDMAFNLSYSGIINKNSDDKFETSGDLSASVKNPTGGSLGVFGPQELALSYKTFSDNIYVNVKSLPSITAMMIPPTIDTTKYLNQWYSVPTKMTTDSFMEGFTKRGTQNVMVPTMSEADKKNLIYVLDESGSFSIIDRKSEKTENGTAVTALYIKIDWDKLFEVSNKLRQEYAQKNGTIYSKSQEIQNKADIEKIKEFPVKNSILKVLVGRDGYIYGFMASGDSMDKLDKQIGSYKFSFQIDNLNKSFAIDRPTNTRGLVEVIVEINNLMSNSSNSPFGDSYLGTIRSSASGINNNSLPSPALTSGILSVQKTANMSIDKGSVTVGGKLQSSNVFEAGKEYVIYLSGVKGFTEFTQYGAPAKFVDFSGKFTVYDENNNIINNTDNIFSSYIGGMPVANAQYIQAKLAIPVNFAAGNYRWELILTDKKNSSNSIKASVNFQVK